MIIKLPGLPPETGRIIRESIASIISGYRPEKVILYGSYARGDYHDGSDLDLILIKSTGARFPNRIEKVLEYCHGEMAVSPLVYTEEEIAQMLRRGNTFLKRALEEGIVVYEQKPRRSRALA